MKEVLAGFLYTSLNIGALKSLWCYQCQSHLLARILLEPLSGSL